MHREPITLLQGKHVILGVCGSIAVYKAVDLASKLTQGGALVGVIMTEAAQRFVAPITFQAVTGRPVYTSMWQAEAESGGLPTHIAHVGLGEGADLLVIAPATANTLAKLAQGRADDLLSVTALAARAPLIVAPAMDGAMYEHAATQHNIDTLKQRGAVVIEPEEGRMASGLTGIGRLPESPHLFGHIRRVLGRHGPLAGHKVLVTAGGTREPLDPVRFLSNRSTGRQGYALAQAALDMGGDVTLITTTDALPLPVGAMCVSVQTANEMLDAVQARIEGTDVLLMAAAVADFRPREVAQHKIKKSGDPDEERTFALCRNPDILLEVKRCCAETGWPRVTVGFAAESEALLDNAQAKLEKKALDLIVANDITGSDAGFAAPTNRVVILDAQGGQQAVELASKARISEIIVKRVIDLLQAKTRRGN